MNSSAFFRRELALAIVVGALVVGAAACAPTGGNLVSGNSEGDFNVAEAGNEMPSPTMSEVAVADIPVEPQLAVSPEATSSSRVLLGQTDAAPGIELTEGANSNQVLVRGTFTETDYKVSEYSNPDRIVVDIFNAPSRVNRVFDTSDAGVISKVRLGAHPVHSRIVLDLDPAVSTSHDVRIAPEGLVIDVASATSVGVSADSFAMADSDRDVAIVSNEVSASDSVSNDMAIASAPVPQILPNQGEVVPVSMTQTTIEGQALEKQTLTTRVTGISIEQVGGGENALVVNANSAGAFSLKRTAPSEYVLKLHDATLDAEATTTLLSQSGAMPIRSVRPVVEGSDVLLRIFIVPEASLEARTKASAGSADAKIVVGAGTEGAYREILAQAKVDATGEGEAVPAGEVIKTADTATATNPASDIEEPEISTLLSETPTYSGRLISLDLQDTDIDNALRILAEVSNLNIIASDDVTGKVTLRLIDVPWDQALDVILKTNGLDKVQEGNVVRIAPVEKLRQERESLKQAQQAEEELEPLSVKYVRISYGRASELKPLVESVISERGSVAYDERTNQLIIKDIRKGIRNVAELVSKVDLRTPQVLLETQIIEAQRGLLRDLGAEIGFKYIRSPATGNATGDNFPNTVGIGGDSSFLGVTDATMSMLFGSADGSQTLAAKISAYESEGVVRVVSRPAVATTNNKQALIKSVQKIRVKLPGGGTSVATGAGATAAGSGATATEAIEAGIELTVTPQASPDYYVLLDLKAKSSTFGPPEVEGIPSEFERSANSTVLVSSGQTFAMGGIYKTEDRSTVEGVPFLKDIPVFGFLFRQMKVDNKDEELLFFITPRIIEGSFDDAAMKASV